MNEDVELDKLLSEGLDPLENIKPDVEKPLKQAVVEQPAVNQVAINEQQNVDLTSKDNDILHKFINKFNDVASKVLDNYDADRGQLEETIQFLDDVVKSGSANKVYVEMLVAALRTKTDTNTNAVKLLDAIAKIVSASKNTPLFVQNNQTNVQADLSKLLDCPEYPDEQR
jgi:ABC-type transporter Mla subunit MlaD